ncbi:hypothetical protein EAL2_c10410 [Peptoclostridium acidaminophilum DSM 3953]|uniref:Cell division protein FtsL n=1 Tax=Peptoclostridium acidaminophilum DSM 3953 TaxID=1286171 RepID=W8T3J3_PEPAC|nr:septum formation initiator family protein [Peptoclostridium acidaminophilum]AHM56339.1 hypothetical protein EAL2_c10410 [Peptoclostridium acidaminophilum DSM 3953]
MRADKRRINSGKKVADLEKYRQRKKRSSRDENANVDGARLARNRSKKNAALLRNGAVAFIAVAVFVIMARYSVISRLNYESHSLSKQLDEKVNEKKELYYEIEMKTNSATIEKEAREKLGMEYPADGQIVYIDVE